MDEHTSKLAAERRSLADQAERCLIASCLRFEEALDEAAAGGLEEAHFRSDPHRRAWSAMRGLRLEGRPATLVAVAERLHERGHLDDLGGYGGLAELYESYGASPQVADYCESIRDAALLRGLARAAARMAHEAELPSGTAKGALEAAERDLFALAESGHGETVVPLSVALGEALDRVKKLSERGGALPGLATGMAPLDQLTGGLQSGELVVVAARPSLGKTAVALAFAQQAAAAGAGVYFASLEMSRVELALRLLTARSGTFGDELRAGNMGPGEARRLAAARDELAALRFFVDDAPAQSVLRLLSNARRLKRQHGLGLVVVDYLQLVEPDDKHAKRHEQVAGISRRLKAAARELNVPLLALAQLNRASESRGGGRPRLADLRESGQIEADADTVILLHREEGRDRTLELLVVKQRNGPVGDVAVEFDRARMQFFDGEPSPFPPDR